PTPAATPPPTPTPTPTPEPEPEPPGQAAPVMRFVVGVPSFYNRGFTAPLEAAPFIADDRTMVPFRAIAEGLGADIDWIEATRTVVFVLDGTTASLSIGVPLPDNMGVPVIVEGRTFVPVRYVSEVLGATVEWNPATRAVYIYQ
ncbi:MAG: copper amine oxidase N-terminal domain-containing protein, partial [Defluviitaleaceae bacterium]|nr:copper amine oxidase N-terminal domain-containing protein [Defluviitaleaceae bacterium]